MSLAKESIMHIIDFLDDGNLYDPSDIEYVFTESNVTYPKSINWLGMKYSICLSILSKMPELSHRKETLNEDEVQAQFRLINLNNTKAQLEKQIMAMLIRAGIDSIEYKLGNDKTLVIKDKGDVFTIK